MTTMPERGGVFPLPAIDPTTVAVDELRCRVSVLLRFPEAAPAAPPPAGHWRCVVCLRVFKKGWSDAEAAAEATARFGKVPEDGVLLCDDCDLIIGTEMGYR